MHRDYGYIFIYYTVLRMKQGIYYFIAACLIVNVSIAYFLHNYPACLAWLVALSFNIEKIAKPVRR